MGDLLQDLCYGLRLLVRSPGFALAAIVSLALGALRGEILFGISARDPLTFAVTVLILTTVALGATWVPARRATRVEPTSALRYE